MKRIAWALFFFFVLNPLFSGAFDERDPLLVQTSLDPLDWSPGQAGRLTLKVTLPPGYHGYSDQIKVTLLEPEGFHAGPATLHPEISFFDKFSKKNRRGFKGSSEISIGIQSPPAFRTAAPRLRIELTYQACSESFCLFPTTKIIDAPIRLLGTQSEIIADDGIAGTPSSGSWLSLRNLQELLENHILFAFPIVFLAGILTSFTPCIFPMIPITLAVIGHEAERRTRRENFFLSLFYVLGIALTYASLGLIAASSGALFGASLGNTWVLFILCLLFLIMALSMYGVFELQVPAFLRQKLGTQKTATNYQGALISGLIAGVVASPCVGPVLVGLLAWVSTTGSHLMGFFLLFTYAMGLGMIFLLLGAFTELTRFLPRSGPWLEGAKFFLASLMLGVFYYYLSFLISPRWHDGALGLGLLSLGLWTGAFSPIKERPILARRLKKALAQAMAVMGAGLIIFSLVNLRRDPNPWMLQPERSHQPGGAAWEDYTEEKYLRALQSGRPLLVDFWAEWCAACHELEQKTFRDPKVLAQLENFTLLRFDATKDSNLLRDLKTRWNIQGLPTVIFIDEKGTWKSHLTLTEFEPANRFLHRLESTPSAEKVPNL